MNVDNRDAAIINVEARNRIRTSKDKNTRNESKYEVLPPCQCNNKCPEKFPEACRQNINTQFCNMEYNERKMWFSGQSNQNVNVTNSHIKNVFKILLSTSLWYGGIDNM